jgi:hypothetical protein
MGFLVLHGYIGLNSSRTNPLKLKFGQKVAHDKLVKIFGKVILHSTFRYTKCRDPQIKTKVEKLWPFRYGKVEMPSSKLIMKEFELDISAKKLQKPISSGNICRRNQHQPML